LEKEEGHLKYRQDPLSGEKKRNSKKESGKSERVGPDINHNQEGRSKEGGSAGWERRSGRK